MDRVDRAVTVSEIAVSSEGNSQVIISGICEGIKNLLGEKLNKIILFGSRARGDYREDSDYDFVIIADFNEPSWLTRITAIKEHMRVSGVLGVSADYVPVTEWEFEHKFFFNKEVKMEGVILYMRDTVKSWMGKANEDRVVCELTHQNALFSTSCYHAQQSAEKYLKAILCDLGLNIPNTHNLNDLVKLLVDNEVVVPPIVSSSCEALNGWDTLARYPGYEANSDDSQVTMINSGRVAEFVLNYFDGKI